MLLAVVVLLIVGRSCIVLAGVHRAVCGAACSVAELVGLTLGGLHLPPGFKHVTAGWLIIQTASGGVQQVSQTWQLPLSALHTVSNGALRCLGRQRLLAVAGA